VPRKKDKSTEDRILQAARKIFTQQGMAGARMQDIADEAGINKALLHYYFKSKDTLFEMIFLESAAQFFPRINEIFSNELDIYRKMEIFCENFIDMVRENPFLPAFVINEINRNPGHFFKKIWTGDRRPNPQPFIAQVQKEIDAGKIIAISPLDLLLNLISMTVFPMIARPGLQANMGVDEWQFQLIMERRKKEIPAFIRRAIEK